MVDDGITERLADAVTFATHRSTLLRANDAEEWLEFLLDAVTDPNDTATTEVSLLGHGATSRCSW